MSNRGRLNLVFQILFLVFISIDQCFGFVDTYKSVDLKPLCSQEFQFTEELSDESNDLSSHSKLPFSLDDSDLVDDLDDSIVESFSVNVVQLYCEFVFLEAVSSHRSEPLEKVSPPPKCHV
jgi:hypothetical protein